MNSWHVRKMQRRNQQRESRRKLSEETFLWKDFLFNALRFLEKKAVCLFVCLREWPTPTASEFPHKHGSHDFWGTLMGTALCPTDSPPLFLTEKWVLLGAAGTSKTQWLACKDVRAQKPRNLFPQHPFTKVCPNLPKSKNQPWTPQRAAEKSYNHVTNSSSFQKRWA